MILERNLLWSSKLRVAVAALGHEPIVAARPPEGDFDVAIVNLGESEPDWPALVDGLRARRIKVVAHAGHKEKHLHDLGRDLRCDYLATNSEISNRLDRVVAALFRRRRKTAVTGGIAEGKSTVLGYLSEEGMAVSSADEVARHVYEGTPVQEWLRDRLGAHPDRGLVRDRVANDPTFRREFNGVVHPLVLRQLVDTDADFIEVPLLIETCTHFAFDAVWVVTCGPEAQLERLTARLGSTEAACALLGTQLPSRAKIPFADVVLRTNQHEDNVRRSVVEAVRQKLTPT